MRRWIPLALVSVTSLLLSTMFWAESSGEVTQVTHLQASPPALTFTVPAPPVCTVAAPTIPQVTLDPNMYVRGAEVLAIQTALGVTPLDSVYGPVTASAVTSFSAPVDGCSITQAQQTVLTAFTSLTSVQDDLTAQAIAARSVVRSSSNTSVASTGGYPRGCPAGGCIGESTPCALPQFVCDRETASINQYNNGGSGASGKYQFMPGTWNGYGGYTNAADAPESVQDAKATEVWAGGAGCGHWAAC